MKLVTKISNGFLKIEICFVVQNGNLNRKHVKVGKDGTVYQEVYYTKEAPSKRFSAVVYALVDKTKKKKKATNDEAYFNAGEEK